MNDYTPKPWKRGECYIGQEWQGWFVFLGQHRDSDALDRSNFDAAFQLLAPLSENVDQDDETPGVQVVHEGHWAVGWVEWIAIHGSNTAALAEASRIAERLENYPVLDEDAFCQLESDEAWEQWESWGRSEFIAQLIKADLITEDAPDDTDTLLVWELYCALIPSGEYYDSEGLNISYAIDNAKRNGLPDKESDLCGLANAE